MCWGGSGTWTNRGDSGAISVGRKRGADVDDDDVDDVDVWLGDDTGEEVEKYRPSDGRQDAADGRMAIRKCVIAGCIEKELSKKKKRVRPYECDLMDGALRNAKNKNRTFFLRQE